MKAALSLGFCHGTRDCCQEAAVDCADEYRQWHTKRHEVNITE